eukprot:CAMPEP_0119127510 /NCGR_PEP_ID=MMETSP1310-20130426/6040_1 /TAXON_ID=464262 /ORGANISM="Genus nov. species nov., Strain RCC2339" /LENGTH=52 /DNA_ID=CAMNT_0007117781 /DNA_START=275 /DNA_END=430 /DNA_ORIENTATION=-
MSSGRSKKMEAGVEVEAKGHKARHSRMFTPAQVELLEKHLNDYAIDAPAEEE